MPEDNTPTQQRSLDLVQRFILATAGLAYITGFLVIFTFYEHFGLRESMLDFFRPTYVYVGFLHLWLPLTVIIPVAGFIYITRQRSEDKPARTRAQRRLEWRSNAFLALAVSVAFAALFYMAPSIFSWVAYLAIVIAYVVAVLIRVKRFSVLETYADSDEMPALRFFHANIIIVVNLTTITYIYVAFAPPNLFREYQFAFDIILALSVFGVYAINWLIRRVVFPVLQEKYHGKLFLEAYPRLSRSGVGALLFKNGHYGVSYSECFIFKLVLMWALIILIALFDWYAVPVALRADLWEMVSNGGWRFPVFLVLAIYILSRVSVATQRATNERERIIFWVIGAALAVILYYVSVISFARTVYPYIPASKGGGNYYGVPLVSFRCTSSLEGALPKEFVLTSISNIAVITKPLVLVEEGALVFYVASPDDPMNTGPKSWRTNYVPKIVGIRKTDVIFMTYTNYPTK